MIEVNNLIKEFGTQKAVNDISFTANKGQILGFLGPNGAGKSTTMKMITSYVPQSSGSIKVCGIDTTLSSLESRKKIGYLPENNPLYKDMYVTEFLEFVSKVHHIQEPKKRINNIVEITGLGKEKHKLIGSLSKGYKQRVGLAQALIHDPEVLILDEPTSGLDMNQLIDIRALIKNLGKDKTVIFSTHIMQEVNALCDRVVIINDGKIVANDSIDQLQNRIKGENLVKLVFLNNNFNENEFKSINEINKIEKNGNELKIYSDDTRDVRPDLFSICAKNNWVIIEMNQEKLSVEYIFQKLTKN